VHRARSGESITLGNMYRELSRLVADGFALVADNPPEADQRRIPYRITDAGCAAFDQWLMAPELAADELSDRLLFVDLMDASIRISLFDRWQDELLTRTKALSRAREDALMRQRRANGDGGIVPAILARQIRLLGVDLEFMTAVRAQYEKPEDRGQAQPRAVPAPVRTSKAANLRRRAR
jgi:DNA-binding PadR family transcriptional regulator